MLVADPYELDLLVKCDNYTLQIGLVAHNSKISRTYKSHRCKLYMQQLEEVEFKVVVGVELNERTLAKSVQYQYVQGLDVFPYWKFAMAAHFVAFTQWEGVRKTET